jgi:hypothetical protein
VARFLSPAWAQEYNDALAGVVLPGPGPDAGLVAADGRFTVAQEVRGGPDGDVKLLVEAGGGHLRFSLLPLDDGTPDRSGPDPDRPDVTIALSYEDAAAMSKGELSPAEALNEGRIRVRGDLSVLVAGQLLVDAARDSVDGLGATTTY